MATLKEIYPFYLNNEAKHSNTDLEVTDKFTGKVAFRVALADTAAISEGIAGVVHATEPMARMASYERQAVSSIASIGSRNGSTSWPRCCASRRESQSRIRAARSTG